MRLRITFTTLFLAALCAVPLPAASVRAYAHVATTSDPSQQTDPGVYVETLNAGELAIWFWQTEDDAATTDTLTPSDSFENNTTVTFAGTFQLHFRAVCASTGGSTELETDDPGGAPTNFMGVARYTGVAASGCLDEALTGISAVNVAGGSVTGLTCAGSTCLGAGVLMTNRNPAVSGGGTQREEDTNTNHTLTYNFQDKSFANGDNDLTWTFDTDGVFTAAGAAFEEAGGGTVINPRINSPVKGGGFNLLARLLQMRYSHPFGARLVSTRILKGGR